MREACALRRLTVGFRRVTCSTCRRLRGVLEHAHGLVAPVGDGLLGLGEIGPEPLLEPRRRFATQGKTFARSLKAVQRPERGLTAARCVGQLVLGLASLLEQRGEPFLRAAPRDRNGVAPRLGVGAPFGDGFEVELRDPGAQRRDLDDELLRTLRCRCLQGERTKALLDLLLDVTGPLDLDPDPRELELRTVLAPLELAEARGLLDQVASVLRPGGEDCVDLALRDDRVHRAAEADVGEQLDEVRAPNGSPVDEVLPLTAADEAPGDRDLVEVDLFSEASVLVVEDELHFAVIGRRARRRASEEDIVGLLGPHLGWSQRSRRPDDRVGDVRLARPVRADDDCDPRLEGELERVHERLEAANLDRLEMHR